MHAFNYVSVHSGDVLFTTRYMYPAEKMKNSTKIYAIKKFRDFNRKNPKMGRVRYAHRLIILCLPGHSVPYKY